MYEGRKYRRGLYRTVRDPILQGYLYARAQQHAQIQVQEIISDFKSVICLPVLFDPMKLYTIPLLALLMNSP